MDVSRLFNFSCKKALLHKSYVYSLKALSPLLTGKAGPLLVLLHLGAVALHSCQGRSTPETLRPVKSSATGAYYNQTPIGEWVYRDERDHVIKQINYYDSSGVNYEARYYSRNKIVRLEYVAQDTLTWTNPAVADKDLGGLLFHEYCQNCHLPFDRSIGPALVRVAHKQSALSFSKQAANKCHTSAYASYPIPAELSEEDFVKIYNFIKRDTVAVN